MSTWLKKTNPRAQAPEVYEKTFSSNFVPQQVESTTYSFIFLDTLMVLWFSLKPGRNRCSYLTAKSTTSCSFLGQPSPSLAQCTFVTRTQTLKPLSPRTLQTHLTTFVSYTKCQLFLLFVTVGEAAWEHWCPFAKGAHSVTSRRRR